MAVPFAFPDENNDVEVILRQISFLLNKLALEIKKQQDENHQLRSARKTRQSGEGSRSRNDANRDTVPPCKQFSPTHALHRGQNEDNDPENQVKEQWDKNSDTLCQNLDQSNLTANDSIEEDDLSHVTPDMPQNIWLSWLSTSHLTTNSICATAVLCVVGWHLLR